VNLRSYGARMSSALTALRPPSRLADVAPTDVRDAYVRLGLDVISDAQLCDLVTATLARPKIAPADSFVLHAPLELLARTALLPMVEPKARDLARQRLVWLAATYAAAGDEVARSTPLSYPGVETAVDHLATAISRGDVDGADDAAAWLAATVTPTELSRSLAESFLPRLSAAGHGAILLYLLPRIAPRSACAAGMARGMVRELARHPDWNVIWHRLRRRPHTRSGTGSAEASGDLIEALRRPRSPGDPASNFIYPTMSIVETSGLAAEVLDQPTQSTGIRQATRDLMRVAAWSMVQDDPDQVPYGWTHCMTMPQAALGIHGVAGIPESGAEPEDSIAVAATYVLGFRATQGRVNLDPAWVPDRLSDLDPLAALGAHPDEAASGVWHAPEADLPAIVARLVTHAAVHPDAHLAKYTLACLDASNADPAAGRLYLAAAAYLGAWWAEHPVAEDPLIS